MIRTLSTVVAAAAITLTAGAARADQCELVDRTTALWAQRATAVGTTAVEFCQPCGDKAPSATFDVEKVYINQAKGGQLYTVLVDEVAIDLAYLFVQTGPTVFTNVAALVGCKTKGVSKTLSLSTGKDATPPKKPERRRSASR